MTSGEMASFPEFVEFVLGADLRFYQERAIGLDLYHSGYSGIAVFALAVASLTVLLLAMFHLIIARKHTTIVLLGLGLAAFVLGAAGSYFNYASLPDGAADLIRDSAGPSPAVPEQTAAVVALPLFCGTATLAFDLAGLIYLAIFWGAGVSPSSGNANKKRKKRG